ncbi:MAG: biotin--[acetyl-CoA-carboxylase] ligase [Candidatus Aminicenantes bacterium RBG_16_63_16]|nr:MAG: biotin--[acetyl-CoA-carboxylase] ligase [Candidatus Aminicenantes bacterium RBG_16_63_16]
MIGSTIYRLATCASTNDVAKQLAAEGAEDGTVVVAEEQTGGRGTKGRAWHSAPGLGLYASVILRPRRSDIALIPALAGVAAADAVRAVAGIRARLKWPNDITWQGKKLGGILSESSFQGEAPSYVIVGIGINVRHRKSDFPADIRATATSLRLASKRPVDMAKLESALWASLEKWRGEFESGKLAEIARAFESRLIFPIGTKIVIERETGRLTATLRGLDTQARLVVESEGRTICLSPAEIVSVSRSYALTR